MSQIYRTAIPCNQSPPTGEMEVLFTEWWSTVLGEDPNVLMFTQVPGVWSVAGTTIGDERRHYEAGIATDDSGGSWFWAEAELPERRSIDCTELEPVPGFVEPLLRCLNRVQAVSVPSEPVVIEDRGLLHRLIMNARSGTCPAFIVCGPEAIQSGDGICTTIWEHVVGLGAVAFVRSELLAELGHLIMKPEPQPGSLLFLFRGTTLGLPSPMVRQRTGSSARRLQLTGLEHQNTALPPSVQSRRHLAEIASHKSRGDDQALEELAEELDFELSAAQTLAQDFKDLWESSWIEIDDLQKDLARREREISQLRLAYHRGEHFDSEEGDPRDFEVGACAEVLEYSSTFLHNLIITADDSITRELDKHGLKSSWAATAWRLLNALNDYCTAKTSRGFDGDLMQYATDPPPLALPLGARRLALHESERTEADPSTRKLREFAVPRSIASDGMAFMPAHLKISQTGAYPRIHFYDDSRGTTGKIVIGYFGPHLRTAG